MATRSTRKSPALTVAFPILRDLGGGRFAPTGRFAPPYYRLLADTPVCTPPHHHHHTRTNRMAHIISNIAYKAANILKKKITSTRVHTGTHVHAHTHSPTHMLTYTYTFIYLYIFI